MVAAVSAVLNVAVQDEAGYAVVTVTGEVDVHSHPLLRERLIAAADRGAVSVIIDAAGIEFIDSSGLGVLVAAYKRAVRKRGHLLIAAPPDRLTKMLAITGLSRVFVVADSVQDAVGELERLAREAV